MKILLVLAVILASLEYGVSAKYHTVDDNFYYVSTPMKKNWYQAQRYCLQNGMYLLNPQTIEENELIIRLITSIDDYSNLTANYWTSGTDLGSNGNHYWATTGDSFDFQYFPAGYPDGHGREHCIEFRGRFLFQWNDSTCENHNYFICRSTTTFIKKSTDDSVSTERNIIPDK